MVKLKSGSGTQFRHALQFRYYDFFSREGGDQHPVASVAERAKVVFQKPASAGPATDRKPAGPGAVDRPDFHFG